MSISEPARNRDPGQRALVIQALWWRGWWHKYFVNLSPARIPQTLMWSQKGACKSILSAAIVALAARLIARYFKDVLMPMGSGFCPSGSLPGGGKFLAKRGMRLLLQALRRQRTNGSMPGTRARLRKEHVCEKDRRVAVVWPNYLGYGHCFLSSLTCKEPARTPQTHLLPGFCILSRYVLADGGNYRRRERCRALPNRKA